MAGGLMMRALVVRGSGQHALEHVPMPQPASDDDAVVEVSYVALCGTDLRLLEGTLHDAQYPVVPGHEWTGVVRHAPSRPGLIGTMVVGSNFIPCGQCSSCAAGRQQLCPSLDEVGFSLPGACADFVRLPAANLRPMPTAISPAAGCLIEPLCVAVHAVDRSPRLAGLSVAVLGGGTIGILVAQVAMAADASSVTVIEPVAERREIARAVGVTRVVDQPAACRDRAAPEIVFDATGSPDAFTQALGLVREAGTVMLVGYSGTETTSLAPSTMMLKELDVRGVLSGYGAIDRALDLAANRKVRLDPLVGAPRPLPDYRTLAGEGTGLRRVLAVGDVAPPG